MRYLPLGTMVFVCGDLSNHWWGPGYLIWVNRSVDMGNQVAFYGQPTKVAFYGEAQR